MKLMIVRHGDPDYVNDSLTEKGWREVEYLAEMLCKQDTENTHYYVSPCGRARDTASATLDKLGIKVVESDTTLAALNELDELDELGKQARTAEVLPWLREFDTALIDRPDDQTRKRIPWDWLPQDWTAEPKFYQGDHWFENERMAAAGVGEEYRRVTGQFDALLTKHGYRREGGLYRAERPNHDTIVLFCHFGLGSVLLSHIWGVSPVVVWHGFCAQPSSVTTLVTEERRKGIATFRMLSYGDTSHLYVKDEPGAFAARFCECWEDDTRHD